MTLNLQNLFFEEYKYMQIRNYQESDFNEISKLLNFVLRLNEINFPKHLIKSFLGMYARTFIDESIIKKVLVINNKIVALCFFASTINHNQSLQKNLSFLNSLYLNLNSHTNLQERISVQLQIEIIKNIIYLTNDLNDKKLLTAEWELKLLIVHPNYQGKNLSKILINDIQKKIIPNLRFWLVTDTNCNWKYYEKQGYKLITEQIIFDNYLQPYKSIDNSIFKIIIYTFNSFVV